MQGVSKGWLTLPVAAVEKFHQPSAAWHASGRYIMAAAAAGHVYTFSIASTKVWARLPCQQPWQGLINTGLLASPPVD